MKKLFFRLCFAVCLSACALSTRVPYQVNSTPPGAKIYVDGISMGIAPLQIELACDKRWVCPSETACHWDFDDYAYEITARTTEDNAGLSQSIRITPCQVKEPVGQIDFALGSKREGDKIGKDAAEMVRYARIGSIRPHLGDTK
jgi:hypothetical protein